MVARAEMEAMGYELARSECFFVLGCCYLVDDKVLDLERGDWNHDSIR